jgi:hypothetical protein
MVSAWPLGRAQNGANTGDGSLSVTYVAVIGMVVAPVVALFGLETGETAFVLAAIGLVLTVSGPLGSRTGSPSRTTT